MVGCGVLDGNITSLLKGYCDIRGVMAVKFQVTFWPWIVVSNTDTSDITRCTTIEPGGNISLLLSTPVCAKQVRWTKNAIRGVE